ncbi:MAG TPA: hypothetical protein VLH79_00295, partial [Chthonomonadales bacterium]|nr:hypothetical protein [Chthonomonadales bacterium]
MRQIHRGLAALALLPAALAGSLPAASAAAQNPVPLPYDPALKAHVGFSANFRSATSGAVRHLDLTAYMAAYSPQEQPDIDTMANRLVTELNVPDEPDWGAFECDDPELSFTFIVADTKKRLGRIAVYEYDSGRLVGEIHATGGGAQVQGALRNDPDIRYYRVSLFTPAGASLGTLLVSRGAAETWVPFAVWGFYQPQRPPPATCTHSPAGCAGLPGQVGDPLATQGVMVYPSQQPTSEGCARLDVLNETDLGTSEHAPPAPFHDYRKRLWVNDTASLALMRLKVKDPAAMLNAIDTINGFKSNIDDLALDRYKPLPYSDSCSHWHCSFRGEAMAMMVVPYERRKA